MPTNTSEIVVITGASAGVGRATVERFARDKAWIGLIARNRERLEQARDEVERAGGRALVLPLDVADAQAIDQAAEKVERELGPIDVWINNAMVSVFSPFREISPDEYRRVTEVTYLGQVYGTMAALKRMLPRDRGVIIEVGSALAYRGIPLQSAYCGAKHAIQGMCDSLRTELMHEGRKVRLSMVQLPAMNTPQFDWVKTRLPHRPQPVPPIFQPDVAANAIHWLAHHDRAELYVGWPTVKAIVGNKLSPRLADWVLSRMGYGAQQTSEPEPPDRPDNLWESVPGPYGAHGRFDSRSASSSPELWMATRRGFLWTAAALIAAAVAGHALKKSA